MNRQALAKRREILAKLFPAVPDEDISAIWRYKPCGRLGTWCMWLARWDSLPPGTLAPFLKQILK